MTWFEDAKRTIMEVGVCCLLLLGNGLARADFAFGTPRNLGPEINSPQDEWAVHVSNDGLSMVFSDSPFSQRGGGRGKIDLWMSTREDMDEPFGPPVNLSTINTIHHDFSPHLSADGLSLYFSSDRPGGYGDMDLWVATRPSRTASFGNPRNMGSAINSSAGDFCPFLSPDGLSFYYNSSRWGGHGSCDIYVATRASVDSSWRTPTNLGSRINTGATDAAPVISEDGLTLYYVSNRSGGFGSDDLYVTTRPSLSSAWERPVNLGPRFNSPGSDTAICFVGGGQTILFCSTHSGGTGGVDIWEMPVIPIVDFNGDGTTATPELARLIHSWGQDDSAVDIAPVPFGDGVVDAADLDVLMSYWGQDVDDPTLAGHWPLDQAQHPMAQDNTGEPIPFTNHAALCQEALLYTAEGAPYGSHWSWRFTQGPWTWLSDADDSLPYWDIHAFAREEDLWPVGGSLSIIAQEPGDPSAVQGTMVLAIEALDHAMNLDAADAIVDEEAGLIMISFGYRNLPGPASTVITGTLERTGVFEAIELVGEQNIYFDGHLFLRRIEGMDLQENIMHVVQTEGPLGGFCTAVWEGHYLAQSATTEGTIAPDKAGDNHGTVFGDPAWHSDGGVVDGALELDGADDYVAADFVLSPADGPFSVFAWVKGGAPGQAILSQQGGADWLLCDPTTGAFMTELKSAGRFGEPLSSGAMITDGDWHRVGFAWDGSARSLYVDDVLVAEDTKAGLAAGYGGLNIGTGKSLTAGTFFSGLIDDVRIYNRTVKP